MEEKLVHFNSIRKRLIALARTGGIITYGDLEEGCNIPNPTPGPEGENRYFYNLLYDLGSFEALHERPPINALVVRKKDRIPGQGFYKWVKLRFNRFDNADPLDVLGDYRVECSKYWSNEENYRLFSGSIRIEYSTL